MQEAARFSVTHVFWDQWDVCRLPGSRFQVQNKLPYTLLEGGLIADKKIERKKKTEQTKI
jgi:hypothetical protein